jgi:hypothetical protein
MDSNTHSTQPPGPAGRLPPPEPPGPPQLPGDPGGLAGLPAVLGALAAEDLDQLSDTALAEQLLNLRGLADRLDGQWLRRLAAVDARGAADGRFTATPTHRRHRTAA